MTGNSCCVKNCHQVSHDEDGKSLNNGLTFFSFPAWRRNEGSEISELTMKRRAAWVAAVGRSNITFSHIHKSTRVCSRHFHSGKPAYERLQSDPDWAPSLELGHEEENGRYTERFSLSIRDMKSKKRKRKEKILTKEKDLKMTVKKRRLDISRPTMGEAGAAAAGREVSKRVGDHVKDERSWSEVRSLLLSVLKSQPIRNKRPADQTDEGTVHAGKETDFRDFFRKSIEESLENFSKSRTPSTQEPPIYVELKEDLSLRVLPVLPVKETSKDSSSSCGNCVKLERKVFELQGELSLLTGGQDLMDVPHVSNKTQVHTDQVPQSRKPAQTEEEVPDWTVSLKKGLKKRRKLSSKSHKLADTLSPNDKPRPTLRFKKAWLRTFDFLRYSPSLNVMWCHICRLCHDKKHQDNGMIKGSRCLKLDNIKNHSSSNYHKENMERYMKQMSYQKPLDSNSLLEEDTQATGFKEEFF
ncbi:uncharacterized protein LOC141796598 [Halichoeres trimaculatus]|uniref:uncharacterized protein LOC141796598 n=1 Tax=Halichoeres trimaculatus TaxID=147232 RepID=UPI003D9DE858